MLVSNGRKSRTRSSRGSASPSPERSVEVPLSVGPKGGAVNKENSGGRAREESSPPRGFAQYRKVFEGRGVMRSSKTVSRRPAIVGGQFATIDKNVVDPAGGKRKTEKEEKPAASVVVPREEDESKIPAQVDNVKRTSLFFSPPSKKARQRSGGRFSPVGGRQSPLQGRRSPRGRLSPLQLSPKRASLSDDDDVPAAPKHRQLWFSRGEHRMPNASQCESEEVEGVKVAAVPSADGEVVSVSSSDESDTDATELKQALHQAALDLDEVKSWCDDSVHSYVGSVGSLEASMLSLVSDQNKLEDEKERLRVELSATRAELNDAKVYFNLEEAKYKEQLEQAKVESKRQLMKHASEMDKTEDAMRRHADRVKLLQVQVTALERRLEEVEREKAKEVDALRTTVAELEKSNAATVKRFEASKSESKELGQKLSVMEESLEKERRVSAEEIGRLSLDLAQEVSRADTAEKTAAEVQLARKKIDAQYEDMAKAFKIKSDDLSATEEKLILVQNEANDTSRYVDDLSLKNKFLTSENSTLNCQIESLKEEIRVQYEVVEVVRSESEKKDREIDSARKELVAETEAHAQLSTVLREEVNSLSESLQQAKIENENLEKVREQVSGDLLRAQSELRTAEDDALKRSSTIMTLKKQNEALLTELDLSTRKIGSIEQAMKEQHVKLAEVSTCLDEKHSEVEALQFNHANDLHKHTRRAEAAEEQLHAFNATHQKVVEEYEEVSQTLTATSNELSSCKRHLQRAAEENARSSHDAEELRRKNEVLTAENNTLDHQLSTCREELNAQRKAFDILRTNKEQEIECLRESFSKSVSAEAEKTQLAEARATDLEKELQTLNHKFSDLAITLKSTNVELDATKSQLRDVEREAAASVVRENCDLSQVNATLTNQIAALMDEIRSQQTRTVEAQVSASKLREEKQRELDLLRKEVSLKSESHPPVEVDLRLRALSEQYEETVMSLETATRDLSDARSQLHCSQEESSRMASNVQEMRRQNEALFSENDMLLSQITSLQDEVQAENRNFLQIRSSLDKEREEKSREMSYLRTQLEERIRLEKERADLAQARVNEINRHIEDVSKTLEDTHEQLSHCKCQLMDAQTESQKWSEMAKDIGMQNEHIRMENVTLKQTVSALQTEVSEQIERVATAERDATRAREEKRKEIEELRSQLSEPSEENERCAQLEAELMQINAQYEEVVTSLRSREVELNETKLQLESAQSEALRNAGNISDVSKQNEKLTHENEALSEQVLTLMSDIDTQQEEISEAKSALKKALEEKMAEVNSLRTQLLEKVQNQTRKAVEAEENVSELEGQLRAINHRYNHISKSYTEVSHELASTKMQLKTTQDAVFRGSLSLDDMMKKHEDLAAENENLSNKISALQVEINVQNDIMTDAQISVARAREEKNAELAALKQEYGEQLAFQAEKTEEAVQRASDVDTELRQMKEQYEEIAMILSSTTEVLVETQAKLERAQEEAREFSGRVDELARKNDNLVVENMSLNDEVSALQIEIQAQNDVMTDAQMAAEQARVNCELALRESREKDARVKELTASYEKAGSELERMNEHKKNSLEKEIQMEILKRSLQSNLSSSEEKCEELEQTNGDLHNVIETLTQEKERLRRSLAEMAETMKGKENLLSCASAKNVELLEELSIHRSEAEQKFNEFNIAIESLEKQLDTAKKERDQVTARLQLTDARENELHRQIRVIDSVRARLHNRIMQLTGNIRVYVRVRPLLDDERSQDCSSAVSVSPTRVKRRHETRLSPPRSRASSSAITAVSKTRSNSLFTYHELSDKDVGSFSADDAHKKCLEIEEPYKDRGGLSQRRRYWKFNFDNVFAPDNGQDDVWKATEPLVQSAIDGYNVCLFAYGQTGSGKTYTMIGSKQAPGVLHRSANKLFEAKGEIEASNKGKHKVDIMVELLEIYNEQVRDLLAGGPNGRQINLRLTSNEAVGNVVVPVEGHRDIQRLISLAQRRRCVKATMSNSESSRSHLLFTLHFRVRESEPSDGLENKIIRHSRLHICDLAGSERIGKSGANTNIMSPGSSLLTETRHINTSLSTLSNVIEKLQANNAHIPFRESKLTYLLRNSLGGDCKTLAIVCCNPVPSHFHESLCSLRFADKVNKVELKASRMDVKASGKTVKRDVDGTQKGNSKPCPQGC